MIFERIVSAFCLGWGIVLLSAGWNRMKDDVLEADKLFVFAALLMIAAGTWWR